MPRKKSKDDVTLQQSNEVLDYLHARDHLTIWDIREALGIDYLHPENRTDKRMGVRRWRNPENVRRVILAEIRRLKKLEK